MSYERCLRLHGLIQRLPHKKPSDGIRVAVFYIKRCRTDCSGRYWTRTNRQPRARSATRSEPSRTHSTTSAKRLDSRPEPRLVTTSRLSTTRSNYSGFREFARNRWPLRGSKHRPVSRPDRVLPPARSRPGHPMGRNRGVCARCWYPKATSRRPHRQRFVDRSAQASSRSSVVPTNHGAMIHRWQAAVRPVL